MSEAQDVNMSAAPDVNKANAAFIQQLPSAPTAIPSTEVIPEVLLLRTPTKATPVKRVRFRLINNPIPSPAPKLTHPALPLNLRQIPTSDGGFLIPTRTRLFKDFIDQTYAYPNGLVSIYLLTELQSFLSLSIYAPEPPLMRNPTAHHISPCSLTFPLWRQTSTCGSHMSTWPQVKTFMRQFRPCIDAAGEAFRRARPSDHAHMLMYHHHLMLTHRVSENPGLRMPVWSDGYRTPFAAMRISVNVCREIDELELDGAVENGSGIPGWAGSRWKVVVFLGKWVDGEARFYCDGEEGVRGLVEIEDGDVWVLAKECLVGNKKFIGERVQVEFFVPELGFMADDRAAVVEEVGLGSGGLGVGEGLTATES